jgi:hypothetical protein
MNVPRKGNRAAWMGMGLLFLGVGAYWYALSQASLSMVYCHNNYQLSNADWECRRVGYYADCGIGMFLIGTGILLVSITRRFFTRR